MMKRMGVVCLIVMALSVFSFSVVHAQEKKVIKIGSQRGLFAALAYAAKDQGYLKDYDINYEWHWFQAGPQMLQAMKGGDIDFALPVGASPAMAAAGNGQRLHFLANMMWGNEVIVLRKDLVGKVDVKNPQSFKNLTVAHPGKGGMQDYLCRLWLENLGVDTETSIKYREVAAGAAQRSALVSKSIDIAVTWEPHGSKLISEGIGVLLTTGEIIAPHHDNTGFVVTDKALQNYHGEVINTLKALQKALDFAKKNPDVFYKITSNNIDTEASFIKSSFQNGIVVLPENLRPGVEWYGKIGAWYDKWGYTRLKSEAYLPEYLGYWTKLQKEAGVY